MVQTRLKVGGHEAWVVVENQEIEHYRIDVDEEKSVATCWIASTAGKHFGIWMAKRHVKFGCLATVYLDGSGTGGAYFPQSGRIPFLKDGLKVEEDSVRPFLFGVLDLTDDDESLDTQSHERIGTIKVEMHRITDFGYKSRKKPRNPFQAPENVTIHERAKTSITHQVFYGKAEPRAKKTQGPTTFKLEEVVATFIFHYRSLDMLKAFEIAPRGPSPEVSSQSGISRKRKAAEVKEEEEKEVKPVIEISDPEDEVDKQKEASLEAELERIRKARLERQRRHAKKKVKCEQTPGFLPGEIIDLTI